MAEIHSLLERHGRQATIAMNVAPRSVIEAASLYMADEDNALAFAYSGWAQCALPHRRIREEHSWEVVSDRMRLVVEPGRRLGGDSCDGPLESLSVPFGAYARLILIYLQTEALRSGSREIELGRSWRDWMSRIGVPWGGKSGRAVREQAELLSRCRLTFHFAHHGGVGFINQSIVDGALFIEMPDAAGQGRLCLETAKLSEAFFESLKRHPIPLEEAAIRALANNSAALDCYVWLAYRLHSLTTPRLVTWPALKAQHGVGYSLLRQFRYRFTDNLAMALAVYPEARIEVLDEGVILKPSRPPVAPRLLAVK